MHLGNKEHKVGGVSILFEPEVRLVTLSIPQGSHVLGAYCVIVLVTDAYAFDPSVRVKVNSITPPTAHTWSGLFLHLMNLLDPDKAVNHATVFFSYTDFGLNAFSVNMNSVIYIIDREHLDNYYLEKEMDRRAVNFFPQKPSPHHDMRSFGTLILGLHQVDLFRLRGPCNFHHLRGVPQPHLLSRACCKVKIGSGVLKPIPGAFRVRGLRRLC